MHDILLIAVPKLRPTSPLLALGQLKAAIQQHDFSCKTMDFNRWLYDKTHDTDLNNIWDPLDNSLMDEKLLEPIREHIKNYIDQFIIECILPHNPRIIGMTAFSFFTFPMLKLFGERLRKKFSGSIVLGGPALTSSQSQNIDLVAELKQLNVIDDFISGDADLSIIEYIRGNHDYPGINNYEFDNNFDRNLLPFPDYSDFDLKKYNEIHLSGSRGCVRKCTFCNVPLLWPKFTSKTGERIAQELIYYYETFDVKRFVMVDSLVNGNHKVFVNFITILAEYNQNNNANIEWAGQFIIRPKHQINENVFDLIKNSGNFLLQVGVESGSEKVRFEIKKPFTNLDLTYHMEHFDRVGLNCTALMFVGFPTETDKDFEDTLDMLNTFSKYKSMQDIGCEHPMLVIPGTPVHTSMENFGITNYEDYFKWTSQSNDYKTRIERWLRFTERCIDLKLKHNFSTGISNIFVDYYMNEIEDKDKEILKIIERLF